MSPGAQLAQAEAFRVDRFPERRIPLVLECVVGDLLQQEVDAIVCPCNSDLTHVAPVPRRIADAAGPTWEGEAAALRVRYGTLGVGTARLQNEAGRLLHTQAVIHAVGPLWGTPIEEDQHHANYTRTLLADTVYDVLVQAHRGGCTSVALPPIGEGHIPGGIIARAHFQGVRRFANTMLYTSLTRVRLVMGEGILVPLLKSQPPEI